MLRAGLETIARSIDVDDHTARWGHIGIFSWKRVRSRAGEATRAGASEEAVSRRLASREGHY